MYVKNFSRGKRWLPGTVSKAEGSVVLELDGGRTIRRHRDHVRPRLLKSTEPDSSVVSPTFDTTAITPVVNEDMTSDVNVSSDFLNESTNSPIATHMPSDSTSSAGVEMPSQQAGNNGSDVAANPTLLVQDRARPTRQRRATVRFDNSWL